MKKKVQIIEVGLRDGLQNERLYFPLKNRFLLVKKLVHSGIKRIELGAFVSPRWVPQMSVSQDLVDKVYSDALLKKKIPSLEFSVLVPNKKGLEKVLKTPLSEASFVISATEKFSKKNINCSIQESFKRLKFILKKSKEEKIKIRCYLSVAFGCPYEGKVREQKVISMIRKLLLLGVSEVSIGDTIGVATPYQVNSLIKKLKRMDINLDQLAMHFHDTRGTALANVYASFEQGIRKFDASIGGLGGCPFAKSGKGNLATEDLVYTLKGMRVPLNIKLKSLINTHDWLEKILKRKLPSHVGDAKLPIRGTIFSFFLFFSLFFFSFFNSFVFLSPAQGGAYIEGGSFARGMGGAGRASLDAYEGMLLNPALIKYSKSRSFALFGNLQRLSDGDFHENQSVGITLIDNGSENLFSGGFSFFYNRRDPRNENSEFEESYFQLSLAEVIYNRVILGVSAYYLKSKQKNLHEKDSSFERFNGVWALHYAPFDQFAMAFVHYNFFPKKSKLSTVSEILHQMSLGFQYIPLDFLKIRFDISLPLESNPKDRLIYQMGLETFSNQLISFRFGSEVNLYKEKNFFTAGFSFNAPRFKLGYAIKRNFKKNEKDMEYSLDLKFSF